jgi:hypothetical protein
MTYRAFGSFTSLQCQFEVLSNTFSVKDVFALRHDCVFGLIVTQSADVAFFAFWEDFGCFTSQHQVRVACHLSHCLSVKSCLKSYSALLTSGDEGENIGVIYQSATTNDKMTRPTVQDSSSTDISRKLPPSTSEKGHVKFLLLWRKVISPDDDRSRW